MSIDPGNHPDFVQRQMSCDIVRAYGVDLNHLAGLPRPISISLSRLDRIQYRRYYRVKYIDFCLKINSLKVTNQLRHMLSGLEDLRNENHGSNWRDNPTGTTVP
jgi:hypothetical protein